jgi:hypothetical protein
MSYNLEIGSEDKCGALEEEDTCHRRRRIHVITWRSAVRTSAEHFAALALLMRFFTNPRSRIT